MTGIPGQKYCLIHLDNKQILSNLFWWPSGECGPSEGSRELTLYTCFHQKYKINFWLIMESIIFTNSSNVSNFRKIKFGKCLAISYYLKLFEFVQV